MTELLATSGYDMIGIDNAELINNLTVNIIENSYGKDYIMLDEEYYNALKIAKKENYRYIYHNDVLEEKYTKVIEPMFEKMYYKLLEDIEKKNKLSYIYTHHIDYINMHQGFYDTKGYENTEKNQIVVDYIASMTDDYFMDLYKSMFPDDENKINYVSYFE